MKVIDHRRHTMRTKPGDHLSQSGVDLARRVGASMGPYDVVITSTVARAFETAIAMGFAVDEQWPALGLQPVEVLDEANWEGGCAEFVRAARLGGPTARYMAGLAEAFQSLVRRVPEGGSALVISHGGIVEAATVACLPDRDFSGWTVSASYCEGVRLHVVAGRFVDAEPLSVAT